MKIGIVGAGQIGGTLTRRLTALGHKVFVANSRGPGTLSDLAAETGATAVSVPEAIRGVDLIVVTIPQRNIPNLPTGLFADTSDRVVVVDTGNYYPRQRDGRIEAIEAGLPESRWVEQQLGRPVIKAFNNIYARHLLELGKPPFWLRRTEDHFWNYKHSYLSAPQSACRDLSLISHGQG
jgi:predicted dinucleotide-binding enzyme